MEVVELGGGTPPLFAIGLDSLEKYLFLVEKHDLIEFRLAEKREKRSNVFALGEDSFKANSCGSLPLIRIFLRHVCRLTGHAARAAAHCRSRWVQSRRLLLKHWRIHCRVVSIPCRLCVFH